MEILVLEASTTSAKAMLYHTEDRSFEVKVRAYTGNYEDVTIHNAENVYLDMVSVGGVWRNTVPEKHHRS